jgi:hypothetical protein
MCAPRKLWRVAPWVFALIASLVLLYFLTAPPVILRIVEKHHRFDTGSSELSIYRPVFRLIESDFGGPVLWYFNRVWHAGMQFDEGEYGPLYAVATYFTVGAVLLAAVGYPFYQMYRRRLHGA